MDILISLVMIVRNEEIHLPKCLDSIQGEVDEMIIVDTGSTDQTREVALNYTDKVYSFPWNDDFSAARNFALQKASGQWILSLDADEFLTLKPGELRSLVLANPSTEAYLLPLYNPISENTEEYNLFHVLRVFRNNGVYIFSGQIHEQVVIQNEHVVDIVSSPVIYHQYLPQKERRRKRERNLKALRKSLNHDPHNPFLHYYTGVEWMMLNKPVKALPYLQTSYQTLPDEMLIFKTAALRYLVIALNTLGEKQKALELILDGNARYPHYADLLYLGGILFQEMKEYTQAVKWLKEALVSGSPPSLYSHLTGTESFLAHHQLGLCYEQLREFSKAQDAYLASLQANPSFIFPLYPLMNLIISSMSPRRAFDFLSEQSLLSHPIQTLLAAEIFYLIGYPNLSLKCIQGSAATVNEFPNALGKYLLYSGEIQAALQVLDDSSSDVEVHIYLCLALLLSGNYPQAHSIALELWQNTPTRCEGYTLIALVALMEKEKLIPLPRRIRNSEISAFLELLYRNLLNYLPELPHDPNSHYIQMMECLETLIKAASPEGGKNLKNFISNKSQDIKHNYCKKFGTGWLVP